MPLCLFLSRLNGIVNKNNLKPRNGKPASKKETHRNTIEWPCGHPFQNETEAELGIADSKPVAHIVLAENNLEQAKEVRANSVLECRS